MKPIVKPRAPPCRRAAASTKRGLALDIVSLDNQRLEEAQEETPENIWLRENCWKYGFILRYPRGKEEITGIDYEPWHFRYVGRAAAEEITRLGSRWRNIWRGRPLPQLPVER